MTVTEPVVELEQQPLVAPGWEDWNRELGRPQAFPSFEQALVAAAALPPSIPFLDVSHFQGAIDWRMVRRAGYLAAVCKLTEGASFVDPRGAANLAGAAAAGLVVGGYHFLRRGTSTKAQFDHFARRLGDPAGKIVALDAETAGDGSDPTLDQADAWSELAQAEWGILPWNYYPRWWLSKVGDCPSVRGPWWHSAFTSTPGPLACGYSRIAAWQHTSSARVPGVAGNVDANRWFGDLASLKATTIGGEDPLRLDSEDQAWLRKLVYDAAETGMRRGAHAIMTGQGNGWFITSKEGYGWFAGATSLADLKAAAPSPTVLATAVAAALQAQGVVIPATVDHQKLVGDFLAALAEVTWRATGTPTGPGA